MLQVLFDASTQLSQLVLVAQCILELHIFPKDKLHLLWLLANLRKGETPLEEMAGLSLIGLAAAIFDFHVHVDGPNVHSLGVVADDTFEHRSTMLWVSIFVLKHAELRDHVDMIGLRQGLQGPLQDSLRFCVVSIFATHVEQELDVAGPDFKALVILLAELLEDVLHQFALVSSPVDVDQLQIDLFAVVDVKGASHNSLERLSSAELALQIHECDPQVELVVLGSH